MKHTLKKIAFVLVIGLLTLAVSCQKDDEAIVTPNSSNNSSTATSKKITFEEFSKNLAALAELEKSTNSFFKARVANGDFYYNTEEVVLSEYEGKNLGYRTYTFPVYREIPVSYIENLVIWQSSQGITSSYMVEYHISDANLERLRRGENLTIPELNPIVTNNVGQRSAPIYRINENCYTYSTQPEGEYLILKNNAGEIIGYMVRCACPQEAVDEIAPAADNGGGSGGGSGNYGGNGIPGSYIFWMPSGGAGNWSGTTPGTYPGMPADSPGGQYQPVQDPVFVPGPLELAPHILEQRAFYNTLTNEQKNFINSNILIQGGVNSFLQAENFSTESKELATQILDFAMNGHEEEAASILEYLNDKDTMTGEDMAFVEEIMDILIENPQPVSTINDYPGKDKSMPYEWWKDENYILENFTIPSEIPAAPEETPNAKEAFLFSIFTWQAVLHVENSNQALNRSAELVTTEVLDNIHNGKADAFRHGFWNALDTAEFGSTVTKLFTDAHEWNSENHPLEQEMDLFNNGIGIDIGEEYGFSASDDELANHVLLYIVLGNLKYLGPLGPSGIIIDSTQIKWTNQ